MDNSSTYGDPAAAPEVSRAGSRKIMSLREIGTGSRTGEERRVASLGRRPRARGRQRFVNARVLVVEDDAANRETLCALLVEMGHTPIAASNGEEAMHVLARGTPIDVIVTDVVMPGMGGLEFTRKAQTVRPGVPVVIVTGDTDAMESVLESGAVALLKPYSAATLERVLEDALTSG